MVAIKGQLVFHVKGNQEQTAEGKHQAHDLDQVQEGVPSKVAKHKTQNHTMKIKLYFIERHSLMESGVKANRDSVLLRLGRPVAWSPEHLYFANDPKAEKFFHREYENGYKL